MDKLLVEVYPVKSQKGYDVFIPDGILISDLVKLLGAALKDMTGGEYIPNEQTIICEKTSGNAFQMNGTPKELGIHNGSKLMLT